MYSVYRWLANTSYLVGVTAGTLATHHVGLRIIPAYPDDLARITTPTIAISGPGNTSGGDDFYGDALGGDRYGISIFGFILGQGSDDRNRRYRDRLMNDVYQLCSAAGTTEGFALYDEVTATQIGWLEMIGVQALLLQANAPELNVERYRFLVLAEIPYD